MQQNDFNFEKVFKLIGLNIWIFIICGTAGVATAYVVNKYAIPTYEVSASLLIKENGSQPLSKGMNDMFAGNLFGANQNLQNALLILQSKPIIRQTVRNLDLEVSYYEHTKFKYHETYNESPFKVIFFREHNQLVGAIFDLYLYADGSYQLKAKKQDVSIYNYEKERGEGQLEDFEIDIKGHLGEPVENHNFKFIIQLTDEDTMDMEPEKRFAFQLRTVRSISDEYLRSLKFNIVDKLASVIEISLETTSVAKGKDFISELINVYSRYNLAEKNHIANMTIKYIEAQLKEVSKTLTHAEDSLQQFLSRNQLVNLDEQASGLASQLLDLRNKQAELLTQKRYYSYVGEYLNSNDESTQIIAPASMGVQDPLLNKLIMDLSTAQSKRANLIQNKQDRNPIVERLGIQIDNLKSVVAENIASAQNSNAISVNELQNRIDNLQREIRRLPKTQMQLGGIERSYQLNDAIYNYLLQKHAEAKITKASNLPDNIVLAPADQVGFSPVGPNKKMIYFLGIFLGLGLPFGALMILMLLKSTIETRDDLEKISNAPILGTVLHLNKRKDFNVFRGDPQSSIAESYRALRTNINFFLNNKTHKRILVSSAVSGEGKSFNALNIASSYALMGCKTVLVNLDLRRSNRLMQNNDKGSGMSTYLAGANNLKHVLHVSELENLHYIPAGPIPPNPMELIASEKTAELFHFLSSDYECIVIDTTPMAQVTDAYNLVKFADVCLMVARYRYTRKKMLRLVLKDLRQKQIEKVALVLNDNYIQNEQYGYGYGYETKKKQPFFRFNLF